MLQICLLVLKCVGYCDDVQNMVVGFLDTLDFSCLKKNVQKTVVVQKKPPQNQLQVLMHNSVRILLIYDGLQDKQSLNRSRQDIHC